MSTPLSDAEEIDPLVVGSFEVVDFPKFEMHGVLAKIDTGADSGAFHCTEIHRLRMPDGKRAIEFAPFDHPEIKIRTRDYRSVRVRSSNGEIQHRFKVRTSMMLQGEEYSIWLTLADRSDMKYDVLIGKQFLQEYGILVDVSKGIELEDEDSSPVAR